MAGSEEHVRLQVIAEAGRDYRYLLDRGYSRQQILGLIVSRYRLNRRERMLLYRCIHPSQQASHIRAKILAPGEVRGTRIAVDGFNNIITVEAVLRGDEVYLCDDGIVRDLSMKHGRIRINEEFERAIRLIISTLAGLGASEITVFYDKQVSRSGELASYTRRIMVQAGISGTAVTSSRSDVAVIRSGLTVSSSDIVILLKADKVFDTPGHIARTMKARIISVPSLLGAT